MKTDSLSWGIIGTGSIAKSFANNLPKSRSGKLVAVGSRRVASAEKFAEAFPGITAHGSYEALLADPAVQAVYIATPHPQHMEWAVAAAHAGKHILSEKPAGTNEAEVMAMIEAARQNKVFLMEAFMYRCHPQIAKVLEIVRSGQLGNIVQINASFAFSCGFIPGHRLFSHDLAGGAIMDVGCYPVSFVRMVAGAAAGLPFANPVEVLATGTLCPESGVDIHSGAVLRFANGMCSFVSTGLKGALDNQAVILGDRGSLKVLAPWLPELKAQLELTVEGKTTIIEVESDRPLYALEADEVAEHLAVGESPAMSLSDTYGNIITLDRWRSALFTYHQEKETATRPRLPRLRPSSATPSSNLYLNIPGITRPISRLMLGTDLNGGVIKAPYAFALFDYFTELGGNCFDSAFIYGDGYGETILGEWIAQRGCRNEIALLVKGGHTPNCFPDKIIDQLNISLDRLQTDHTEFYMMHRDNPDVPVGEFVEALNEQVRAGRIKRFGGSNWSIERVKAANEYAERHGLQGFGCLSNQFSLARMVAPLWAGCLSASDAESSKWLEEQQLPLFAWSSQARGFFVRGDREFQSAPELVRCWYSEDNFERLCRARFLAKKRGVDPILIAAAYVLAQPFPLVALIGPWTLSEMSHSFRALSIELTKEERLWLNLERDSL